MAAFGVANQQQAPTDGHLSSLPAWPARSAGWTAAPNLARDIRWTLSGLQRFLRSGSVGYRRFLGQNDARTDLNARTVRDLIILVPVGRKAFRYSRKLLLIFGVHQISLRETPIVVANEGGLSGFREFGKFGCFLSIALCL
jgi:hypothetical protein